MTKEPLILLPGLLNDAALWDHQIATLGDMAAITVADLSLDDSIEAMAGRVLATAPSRFALAGLSMGGYVAQEIMRRAPERVMRLALVDTAARADLPEQSEFRRGFIEMARQDRFAAAVEQFLPNVLHPDHLATEGVAGTVRAMAARLGPEVFVRQQTAIMHRPDGRGDLARIGCPTLLLCGRQDALTPPKVQAEMAARIAGAKLVIIEDAGHLSPLEQPVAVSAVFSYWLQDGGR